MKTASIMSYCAALALIVGVNAVGATTVYKWTDDKGVVNYTTDPPPGARKAVAVNAAPALDNRTNAGEEEARYWRERNLRESLRDFEEMRLRRESESWRQGQARQQTALSSQSASADDERRRLAREQCLRERRVDCDGGGAATVSGYYQPSVVVLRAPRQTIQQAAPFPVTGPTLGPQPGSIAGTQPFFAPAPVVVQQSASIRRR